MDRNSKVLLAIIAAGLWMNIAGMFIRSTPAIGQSDSPANIALQINSIANDFHALVGGSQGCNNPKICN